MPSPRAFFVSGARMKTRDMAYISISAALIALCAWLSIPAAIPFTMQTFAVFAVSGTLGARRGALALGVYILLGALGLPVFSGFQGGPGALLGATGGYIVGFLPAALIAGLGAEHLGRSLPALIFSMCAGLLACYVLGTAWYVAVYARAGEAAGVQSVLAACVVPFIPADAAKIFLAAVLSKRLAPLCSRNA